MQFITEIVVFTAFSAVNKKKGMECTWYDYVTSAINLLCYKKLKLVSCQWWNQFEYFVCSSFRDYKFIKHDQSITKTP